MNPLTTKQHNGWPEKIWNCWRCRYREPRGSSDVPTKHGGALSDPNSRVVFVGHISEASPRGPANAVVLDNGRSAGQNSVIREVGPPDANGVAPTKEVNLPTTTISANSVDIFGCNSIELAPQYSGVDFVGVYSGTYR